MPELALLERGPFDILKLEEIAWNFSLFLITFAIFRRILDAEMKDGTRAGVDLKAKQKEKEPVTDEEERQLWQSGVIGMETAKSFLNVVYVRGCRNKAKNCALFTRNVCVEFV